MYTFSERKLHNKSVEMDRFLACEISFLKMYTFIHLTLFQVTTKTIFTKCEGDGSLTLKI